MNGKICIYLVGLVLMAGSLAKKTKEKKGKPVKLSKLFYVDPRKLKTMTREVHLEFPKSNITRTKRETGLSESNGIQMEGEVCTDWRTGKLTRRASEQCRFPWKVENPKTDDDSLDEAYYYAPYASVAYCDMDDPSFDFLKCRSKNKLIAYKPVLDEPNDLKAEIFIDEYYKEIILTYRGSNGGFQAMGLAGVQAIYSSDPPEPLVYSAFEDDAKILYPGIIKELKNLFKWKYSCYRLVIVGHSLGGAMAVISAPQIRFELKLPENQISVYTYGQPRAGNRAFADWYAKQYIHTVRVVNGLDRVTQVPNRSVFVHVGTEIYIKNDEVKICKTKYENLHCSTGDIDNDAVGTTYLGKQESVQGPLADTETQRVYYTFADIHNHAWNVKLGTESCSVKGY